MAILIKTDKNGTNYWHEEKCPKCCGQGYIPSYHYVDNGVCFKCNGSGIYPHDWKEYTPEYAEKLEERRIAREKKKAPEKNAKFFRQNGFNEEGFTWLVIGNTFDIKEELKAASARFNNILIWHFDHEQTQFPTVKISIEDVGEKNIVDCWKLDEFEAPIKVKEILKQNAPKTKSEHVGSVGDKIDIIATLIKHFTYETHFTYYGELNFIYKFSDESGNTIIWKTAKSIEDGKTYRIKGTIKEHSEYEGDKQTVLTRCKITEMPQS